MASQHYIASIVSWITNSEKKQKGLMLEE